jgi:hypothetical protein
MSAKPETPILDFFAGLTACKTVNSHHLLAIAAKKL